MRIFNWLLMGGERDGEGNLSVSHWLLVGWGGFHTNIQLVTGWIWGYHFNIQLVADLVEGG